MSAISLVEDIWCQVRLKSSLEKQILTLLTRLEFAKKVKNRREPIDLIYEMKAWIKKEPKEDILINILKSKGFKKVKQN